MVNTNILDIIEKIIIRELKNPEMFKDIISYTYNTSICDTLIDNSDNISVRWRDMNDNEHWDSIPRSLIVRHTEFDNNINAPIVLPHKMVGSPELSKCSSLLWGK